MRLDMFDRYMLKGGHGLLTCRMVLVCLVTAIQLVSHRFAVVQNSHVSSGALDVKRDSNYDIRLLLVQSDNSSWFQHRTQLC